MYSFVEYCVGCRNAQQNERTKTAAFFSIDSGSEAEGDISINVSMLDIVSVFELGRIYFVYLIAIIFVTVIIHRISGHYM